MKRSSSSAIIIGTSASSASSSGGEVKCCINEELVRPAGEICRTSRWPVACSETVGEGNETASMLGFEGEDPAEDTAGNRTGLASRGGADSLRRNGVLAESA